MNTLLIISSLVMVDSISQGSYIYIYIYCRISLLTIINTRIHIE